MIAMIKKLERMLILALVAMMALVVVLATVELGWIITKDVVSPRFFSWKSRNCWKSLACSCWC